MVEYGFLEARSLQWNLYWQVELYVGLDHKFEDVLLER
jgi:hypothetical protein